MLMRVVAVMLLIARIKNVLLGFIVGAIGACHKQQHGQE
jgi:hypothetical protein